LKGSITWTATYEGNDIAAPSPLEGLVYRTIPSEIWTATLEPRPETLYEWECYYQAQGRSRTGALHKGVTELLDETVEYPPHSPKEGTNWIRAQDIPDGADCTNCWVGNHHEWWMVVAPKQVQHEPTQEFCHACDNHGGVGGKCLRCGR